MLCWNSILFPVPSRGRHSGPSSSSSPWLLPHLPQNNSTSSFITSTNHINTAPPTLRLPVWTYPEVTTSFFQPGSHQVFTSFLCVSHHWAQTLWMWSSTISSYPADTWCQNYHNGPLWDQSNPDPGTETPGVYRRQCLRCTTATTDHRFVWPPVTLFKLRRGEGGEPGIKQGPLL